MPHLIEIADGLYSGKHCFCKLLYSEVGQEIVEHNFEHMFDDTFLF